MADENITSSTAALTLQSDDITKETDIKGQAATGGSIFQGVNWVKYGAFAIFCAAWFSMVGVLGYWLGHPEKFQ